jgi:hypothetical protein
MGEQLLCIKQSHQMKGLHFTLNPRHSKKEIWIQVFLNLISQCNIICLNLTISVKTFVQSALHSETIVTIDYRWV